MEGEFIPYEQALALKELGFDESTYTWRQHGNGISGDVEGKRDYYNRKGDVYTALPLYQQAFRWFREKHGYYYELFVDDDKTFGFLISYFVEIGRGDKPIQRKYTTYEEAELECLKKLIEIIKEK